MFAQHIIRNNLHLFSFKIEIQQPFYAAAIYALEAIHTLCCSSWMLAKYMWEAFDFPLKGIIFWEFSTISRIAAYVEWKISLMLNHHHCIPHNSWFGPPFPPKPHWAIFTSPNDYCSALSMIEFARVKSIVGLWEGKVVQDSPRLHRMAEVLHFITSKIQ